MRLPTTEHDRLVLGKLEFTLVCSSKRLSGARAYIRSAPLRLSRDFPRFHLNDFAASVGAPVRADETLLYPSGSEVASLLWSLLPIPIGHLPREFASSQLA